MKTMLAVMTAAMLMVSCDSKKSNAPMSIGIAQTTEDAAQATAESRQATLNGNTLTYGQHSYTVNGDINFSATDHRTPTATVAETPTPEPTEEPAPKEVVISMIGDCTLASSQYACLLTTEIPEAVIQATDGILAITFTVDDKDFVLYLRK